MTILQAPTVKLHPGKKSNNWIAQKQKMYFFCDVSNIHYYETNDVFR